MLVDTFHRGNSSRCCWFSVSTDLYLAALGCNARVINGLQTIDAATRDKNWHVRDTPRAYKTGVMSMTYSSLVRNTEQMGWLSALEHCDFVLTALLRPCCERVVR